MSERKEKGSTPPTDDPLSVVIRHLDAYNRRDLDVLLDDLAEDVVFMTGQDAVRGPEQLDDLDRRSPIRLDVWSG